MPEPLRQSFVAQILLIRGEATEPPLPLRWRAALAAITSRAGH